MENKNKAHKFGHLSEFVDDLAEIKRIKALIFKMDWDFSPLQNVNDSDGCYIQSILWLCDLDDIWEQMEDCGRVDYLDGEEAREILRVVNQLNTLMLKNDLEFIFI